jgi:hypothetical protein
LDVVRAVAESGRADDIALYTGNDDNIVVDLVTNFEMSKEDGIVRQRFSGGLLGHWACGTRRAVELLTECRTARESGDVPAALLTKAAQITEANAALFDAANQFAGCIPGIHHLLHRQGLLSSTRCLNPNEKLSPGQADAIDTLFGAHSWMNDDKFVEANLDAWLS